jgi:hypothetical protein
MNQYCGIQQALGLTQRYTSDLYSLQLEAYQNVGMGNVSVTRDIDIRLLEVRKKIKDVRWKMQRAMK